MAKILCIEDETAIRQDILEELHDAGYETLEAADGEAGLAEITAHRPDLILCDITMPRMDGLQLLAELRKNHPEFADLPFVFLSALADKKQVIEGKSLGADDYLTKPIDFDLLLVTVQSRLRQVDRMTAKKEKELVKLYKAVAHDHPVAPEKPAPTAPQAAPAPRPMAPAPARAAPAGQPENPAQLKKQLSDLADRGSGQIVTGRFHLIGLGQIKEDMGKRWDENAQKAQAIAEQTIIKSLTSGDVLKRKDDNDFLVCFSGVSDSEVAKMVGVITDRIRRVIHETCERAESADVSSESFALDFADDEIGSSEDALSLIAAKLDQACERAKAADNAVLQEVYNTSKLTFRQIQTRAGGATPFTIADFDPDSRIRIKRVTRARADPADINAQIDLLILGRVTEHLYGIEPTKRPTIITAVHFPTVAYARYSQKHQELCRKIAEDMKNSLIFNVKRIPKDLMASRVTDAINCLRPSSRARMVQIAEPSLHNLEPMVSQVAMVAIDFADIKDMLGTDWKTVENLIQTAHANRAKFLIDRVPDSQSVQLIGGLGMDFVSLDEFAG